MKKSGILILLAVALLGPSACSTDAESSASTATGGTTTVETQATTTAATEITTEAAATETATTAVTTETAAPDIALDYDSIVNPLLDGLNELERLCCTFMQTNDADAFVDEASGSTYVRSLDTEYASTAEIAAYMDTIVTENLRTTRYCVILDAETPNFVDHNGALYLRHNEKGGGISWTDEAVTVEAATDTTFTVTKAYTDFDVPQIARLTFVKSGSTWRVDSLTLNA